MTNKINQSKNDFVVYRAECSEDLHNAIMSKDIEKIELIIKDMEEYHNKYYDFLLYDQNTTLNIDYVYAEHLKTGIEGV